MSSSSFLNNAKVACRRLVEELFPREATIFDDAWGALLPLFEKWERSRLRARRFSAADLSVTTGLGFEDDRDWALPISVMATVATMLEIWQEREGISESAVRGSVAKYAHSFGAPKKLQTLLVDKATPFCLEVYRGLAGVGDEMEGKERRRKIEEAMPKPKPPRDYIVQTHKDEEPTSLTIEELKEFKKKHKPDKYFVWIDESEAEVFVDGKRLPIGSRPRKVLQYLIQLRGQRVTHGRLVTKCGDERYAYPERGKAARRWVSELRSAGKGQLEHRIKTKDGGYVYDGPGSFCIIKQRSYSG